MATTSPLRTLVDLDDANTRGGHLGTYLRDALEAGAIRRDDLDGLTLRTPAENMLDMAGPKPRR